MLWMVPMATTRMMALANVPGKRFKLQGSLEVDLGKNTLLKLHITLTDPKASPAKGDPLYRFVIVTRSPTIFLGTSAERTSLEIVSRSTFCEMESGSICQ